jgi:2-oxoisovalerate dehydrogenase E1 component
VASVNDRRNDVSSAFTKEEVLSDYEIACHSRHTSLIGRQEVLTGKAKFGIFGDGKEVPQLAMARAFKPGDFRAGYYRDQTFMLAAGMVTISQLFAQLYADTEPGHDPASSGRQMNSHFATPTLDEDGHWLDLTSLKSSSADISPTAGQMPRLVGLAYASKLYRELPGLAPQKSFSDQGREIAFGTIGNASCAEGMFWEAINAAGVLKVPLLMSIWDDGYGISVPNLLQHTKDLSELLSGFRRNAEDDAGVGLETLKGWDYPALCEAYGASTETMRRDHIPTLFHVVELTQPQGHSTSGSHERYKDKKQLDWERDNDCLKRMREWIESEGFASADELEATDQKAATEVREIQRQAWDDYMQPLRAGRSQTVARLRGLAAASRHQDNLEKIAAELERVPNPMHRQSATAVHRALVAVRDEETPARRQLIDWHDSQQTQIRQRYSSHLYSESSLSALAVDEVAPIYGADSPQLKGFEIINHCFDAAFKRCPELVAFGEDVGALGDVNQGFAGLQEKYGALRISDTGIRETTILGQAVGLAMRGLRPVAEIQYLDYILYALPTLADDLATVRYRSAGRQKAPVILRTRGHRLEGVWHSGSPMAGLLNLVRGVYICVPRNMTQAAGFYNTMLASDDSAIVVEVLNGYRLKETLPQNIAEMTVPLGEPEILRPGNDVTLVTYGACCQIALRVAEELAEIGIEVEVIDVQTLLPFDRDAKITESLRRTHRVVFFDEDVPGGTTAYMMQKVLEDGGGYAWLDSEPRTVSSHEHRPAYGSDGDYYSKSNSEDVFHAVYGLMHESEPTRFPIFYR